MRLKHVLSVVSLASLLATGLFAAKECLTLAGAEFPGVDAQGNLDVGNTGLGTATLCVNTRSGKVKLKGTAQVPNESGSTQKFNRADFPAADEFITKVRYRVKADGAAKLTASGRVDPNDLP